MAMKYSAACSKACLKWSTHGSRSTRILGGLEHQSPSKTAQVLALTKLSRDFGEILDSKAIQHYVQTQCHRVSRMSVKN